MNIPEEFGKYLLLKKLTEDPLGETFRAGKVGDTGTMEQVVLLRVFNGKGLDGERLWAKISTRSAVQQALKSPNIGSGVDLGRVRSFPYTAYDYISGKNLATVFAQSARQLSPVPTDHALLIAERISLALAAAYESRVQDERILHGFLVPQLVMISNEGETRLLGFEAAPGLRDLMAGTWNDESLRPYLSPETLTGAPVGKTDDVYSLGALLFELLTGERPPAPGSDLAAAVDAAVTANEGTPLPAPVAGLLKKSLAPKEQRIADAVTWHKTLSKLMIDGHFSPTTFNLAFFMHNLFREEIERESQEIQAEKKLELTRKPAPPAAVAAPVAAAATAAQPEKREATGVRQGTLAGAPVAAAQPAPKSKTGLILGIAAVLLLAAAGGGYYFLFMQPGGTKTAEATPGAAALPAPAGTSPAPGDPNAQAAPSPEEIQAQIQQMFEARQKEMESKLQTQYDDRIKELQKQLEDSRRAAAAEPSRPVPVEPAPVEARKPEPPPTVVPEPRRPEPAPAQAAPAPAPAEREEKPAPVQAAPSNPVPAPAPRQQAQVQTGDLVQPGPGVTAPKLTSKLDPRYPPAAQRMKRAAQVDIKVLVDERGRVLDAERIGAKAGFGFDEAALDAARRATFQPAVKEGVRVKMWTTLRVNFKGL